MTLISPALAALDARLPLDGLEWDAHAGTLPEAAVLVALTDEAEPRVLLGRRCRHLSHHPGEVAFPGGKREPGDASPWVTATREAWEEVGLRHEQVHPLGELQPLVTRTGFEVHPCIAKVPAGLAYRVDTEEFESVFSPALSQLADHQLFRLESIAVEGRVRKVPHYHVGDDDIWGVTAAVLAMLANIAFNAGLDLQRDWSSQP